MQNSEVYDPRIVPEYEMKFKQAVTAEDVFLGVSVAQTLPESEQNQINCEAYFPPYES